MKSIHTLKVITTHLSGTWTLPVLVLMTGILLALGAALGDMLEFGECPQR
ncbi:hypothetical protein P3T23_008474 [Paraburkholderia sp. GAS448]